MSLFVTPSVSSVPSEQNASHRGKLLTVQQKRLSRIVDKQNTQSGNVNKRNFSVLRYPGAKQKAIEILNQVVPQGVTEMVSPFVGGASFELFCAQERKIQVYAFDKFEPLINFWQCLKEDAGKLVKEIQKLHPLLSKVQFYELRDKHIMNQALCKWFRAAGYFACNRASFSGLTCSGGYSSGGERFTQNSIDALKEIDLSNLEFYCGDFEEAIQKHPNTFLFCDPPYALDMKKCNLYGYKGDLHRNFDHSKLFNTLQCHTNKWLLCYNDCSHIRTMYRNYSISKVKWTYGMNTDKKSNEIVITNSSTETTT